MEEDEKGVGARIYAEARETGRGARGRERERERCGEKERNSQSTVPGINTPASCDHSSCHAPLLSPLSLTLSHFLFLSANFVSLPLSSSFHSFHYPSPPAICLLLSSFSSTIFIPVAPGTPRNRAPRRRLPPDPRNHRVNEVAERENFRRPSSIVHGEREREARARGDATVTGSCRKIGESGGNGKGAGEGKEIRGLGARAWDAPRRHGYGPRNQ